jgi:hypothetical protein
MLRGCSCSGGVVVVAASGNDDAEHQLTKKAFTVMVPEDPD